MAIFKRFRGNYTPICVGLMMLTGENRAWDKFNTRTQMMKGLFNYETAYRKYTKALLEDFVRDKIQYAEIRPNFMAANNLWTDDGTEQIDNEGIMKLIIDEYRKFQAGNDKYFGGMKIIYCTPRSLSNTLVKAALAECLKFKKMWPEWVAGKSATRMLISTRY